MDNILLAEKKAMRGRKNNYGVMLHLRNREISLLALQNQLREKKYLTSEYNIFKVYEPKERTIYRLPFYPDRICHHAIMNIMEPIWVSLFTRDTYSCIKNRGIHAAFRKLKQDLKNDVEGTQYCLKLDIRKFYENIDHAVLKSILSRKIKDGNLLQLFSEIIDTAPGVPIGNYLSQFFANVYLAYFDHWMKEGKRIKYYYRYADDMVILSDSKNHLHNLFSEIKNYLSQNLKLDIKKNWQVFPVESRSIDFVGYRFYHTHILLRKSIKKNMARAYGRKNKKSIAAYNGWAIHCDSKHLLKKLTA